MKAGPYTITQAEAIRRTKQLLASCEPKTEETGFAHRLLQYFTLSADKGYPVFVQQLVDCYTDKKGVDIGEPPDTYENFGWVYPQLMIANLEEKLGQSRIAEQVKNDVKQMLYQATKCADLAEAFLRINSLASSHVGGETLMLLHCFAFEIQKTANGPGVLEQLQKCASGADKVAASSGKSEPKRKRQAVTQGEAAKICGVKEKTIRRWEKGEGTPEGYPGRGDAVALGTWVARRKESAAIRRALHNTVGGSPRMSKPERVVDNWRKYGKGKPRENDY